MIAPSLAEPLRLTHGAPEKKIKPGRLGLLGVESFRYYVHDPERSRRFYIDGMGFKEVARSTPDLDRAEQCRTVVYGGGQARVEVGSPLGERTWPADFLRRHPDGVSNVAFRVRDLDYAVAFLRERGASFIDESGVESDGDGGPWRSVTIATPLGDVTFTFIERPSDYDGYAPGFERTGDRNPRTDFGFRFIDHITANALTMMPVVWFYKHVMGLEEYWSIQFHTAEAAREGDVCLDWHKNSGLRSIVMWDPDSGVKFATNEPLAPAWRNSQIAQYCRDNFGPGVQHLALAVPEICETVEELLRRNILFLEAPEAYYDNLPERLKIRRIFNLDKPIERLRDLGILLDGEDNHYLLQIFLKDSAQHYDDPKAGPFFYELIQRAGARGFGEGNFRALFESIEKEQAARPLM
jgi:4-hydroxyphenylpyruvate dioxygenase